MKLINSLAPSFLDWPMIIISSTYFWLSVFVILTIRGYLKIDPSIFKRTMTLIIICFALTDFISGNIAKPNIKRLRPCKEKTLRPQLNRNKIVRCGGMYGFFSSHASNSFGIAFLLLFLLQLKTIMKLGLLSIPFLISFSRIYLAKHYPTDIIAGLFFGLLIAFLLSKTKFFKKLKEDYILN
ncbi:phosphatase PAP2 family protein [Bacteriovoracaceae bacterium]|nr:phosphatase PAP2 family protein [Bacteriovoracaceae bacterium]